MSDFWVGNFRVDVSRAQIIVKDDIISLEPRVLKVLLTLAKHQGEVVTHEALLESVWPNVVVAPNAVQRCIGQLRKALGDDAKQQKMIATHPKIGYSLIAQVQWPEESLVESAVIPEQQANSHWIIKIFLLCLSLLVLAWYFLPSTTTSPPIDRLTPITLTDEKEYYPSFSPDGRYVVYNRYVNLCENQLWAKDLTENREYRLTKTAGYYGAAAWSPDGNQLAFSKTGGCQSSKPIQRCRNISAISFILAKSEPQIPRELLACEQHNYGGLNWLTNNKIAFIDSFARQGKVKTLSLDSSLVTLLYSDESYQPRALSYSPRNKKLAITVHDQKQNISLILFNTENNTIEHLPLKVPDEHNDYLWWDPIWHPLKDTLITSAETSLFEIDMAGSFTEYPITTVADIYNPMYHPDGEKIIAVIGGVDLDIEEYRFQPSPLTKSGSSELSAQLISTIEPSTVEDYQAKYQPGTSNISFISNRSGEQQIWFVDNNQLKQLSHFDRNTRINSYTWSLDGQSLALAVRGELHLLTLDGQANPIPTPFKVIEVYQWVNTQQVLLSIIEKIPSDPLKQQRKVVLLDLNTGEHSDIYQGFSHWAQLNGQSLYYTDWSKTLHLYQDQQNSIVPATSGIRFSPGFIIKDRQLSLFAENQIWLYHLDKLSLTKMNISPSTRPKANLSDIDFDNNRLLFSIYQSTRKDLVMFHR
ncbi:MAG: winged helix-turn-helix domain-containing protein [Colwellia sp.]|nr:winged helix-turn-helix domain-containing protein [Colwellia sp.]